MSLLERKQLPYPTYNAMIDYLLGQIQERLATDLNDIAIQMTPALLNRINTIARNAYKDLEIAFFTYDEMVAILESDEQITAFKNEPMIFFTLLKPTIEVIPSEDGPQLAIEMAIDLHQLTLENRNTSDSGLPKVV